MNKVMQIKIKNLEILIDEKDYKLIFEELGLSKWSVKTNKDKPLIHKKLGKNQLAKLNDYLKSIGVRKLRPNGNGTKEIKLDSLIMKSFGKEKIWHQNGNELDKRRINLRIES